MKDKSIQELINLYHSGKLTIVEKKVIELIKKNQKSFVLYNLFGAILADQKNFDKAIINYKKSLEINSDYAEGHNNLGSVLYKIGKFSESIDSYQRAIKIKPDFTEAYNNLGLTFKELGKFSESIDSYQRAIKIKPDFTEAYNNLGLTFEELGKFNESIDSYQRAIKINPEYAEAYNNLGVIFKMTGKFSESIDSYQRAIKINPEYAEAYNNLGNVYNTIEKVDEAILNYKKAIKINANFTEAYSNLGNLFKEIGKVDEARNYENKLLDLKPNDIGYRINTTLSIVPIVNSVEEINFYRNEYKKGLEFLKKYQYLTEKPGDTIKTNFFHLGYHAIENLELMKKTSDLFRQIIPNINYISKNINKQKKQKKIKVGFISEFLTNHTVGKLFVGLIKNIDRKKFDIIIFHTLRTKKSLIKNEIDNHSNKVINLNDRIKDQHEQVEKENLDIIFYPEIGMSSTTYFLAFARLAPVQIVSWGHPETTGINTIDYFLSSTLLEPNSAKSKYSEKLICLSQLPLYYKPPQNLSPLKNRKDLKLPENVRLYGCPQSLFKLHPDFDLILAEILFQDPEGIIVLIGGEGKKKYWSEILKKRWSKSFSILNKKVLFTNTLSLLEFISLCKCVDVLLDPLHFGGGNSFLEAMLVGTPSITMPGTHLKTNVTAAAYKQMKILSPPIVKSSKEYVNLAVELAQDSKKNLLLREESKTAANKYLYNNLKALKEFEQFLEDTHVTAQLGNKLKDRHKIRV